MTFPFVILRLLGNLNSTNHLVPFQNFNKQHHLLVVATFICSCDLHADVGELNKSVQLKVKQKHFIAVHIIPTYKVTYRHAASWDPQDIFQSRVPCGMHGRWLLFKVPNTKRTCLESYIVWGLSFFGASTQPWSFTTFCVLKWTAVAIELGLNHFFLLHHWRMCLLEDCLLKWLLTHRNILSSAIGRSCKLLLLLM